MSMLMTVKRHGTSIDFPIVFAVHTSREDKKSRTSGRRPEIYTLNMHVKV